MEKRQHTMQLCFRAEGPQLMPPAVIFKGAPRVDAHDNVNPREPYTKRLAERRKYDKRVIVYWDPKAYAGCAVSDAWLEDFQKYTHKADRKRILGLDNFSSQANDRYEENAKKVNINLAYTPENCTDLVAVTDAGLGYQIKRRVVAYYQADLEKSEERLNQWKNGNVSTAERRILFTTWLGDAWEDYTTNHQDEITNAFKRCGMYNDIDGKENHLVKLERMKDYKPPLKTDKPAIVKKKKGRKRKRKIEPKKSNKKAKITDFFSKK